MLFNNLVYLDIREQRGWHRPAFNHSGIFYQVRLLYMEARRLKKEKETENKKKKKL